jgi:pimeloyl-ACP methyl ester carboxylesterase
MHQFRKIFQPSLTGLGILMLAPFATKSGQGASPTPRLARLATNLLDSMDQEAAYMVRSARTTDHKEAVLAGQVVGTLLDDVFRLDFFERGGPQDRDRSSLRHDRGAASLAPCRSRREAAYADFEHDKSDLAAGKKITTPIHVIWGSRGIAAAGANPLDVWKSWAMHVTGEAVEAGHFMCEEAPRATQRAILNFLAG